MKKRDSFIIHLFKGQTDLRTKKGIHLSFICLKVKLKDISQNQNSKITMPLDSFFTLISVLLLLLKKAIDYITY